MKYSDCRDETNNERFNQALNACRNTRRIFNALQRLTEQNSDHRLEPGVTSLAADTRRLSGNGQKENRPGAGTSESGKISQTADRITPLL